MELKDFYNINKYVNKGWGYEIWVANSPLYCGKVLCLYKGKKLSWHYHKLKDETFFCLEGKAMLHYSLDDCMVDGKFDPNQATIAHLTPGVAHHIKPLMRHQVVAEEMTYLMEASSEHFDSDSYRLERGD